jgi:hypothetical protein
VFLLVAYRKVSRLWARRYRPELHYMRGPGPKCRERHPEQAGGRATPGTAPAPTFSRPRRLR